MFQYQPVRLQEVPIIRRCHSCHQLRFAIASQLLIHKPSGRLYCRWLCRSCGKPRGLRPTREYLKNLREMDEGNEAQVSLKVLAQV